MLLVQPVAKGIGETPQYSPKRKTLSRDYTGGCIQVMFYCPADQSQKPRSQPETQKMPRYSPASRGGYQEAVGVYCGKQ